MEAFRKLNDHLANCRKKINGLEQQLLTAQRHYAKAMDTMAMVAGKQQVEIPPDEVQALLLNGMKAEAGIKLLRFPLFTAELLKIKIAALKREEQATLECISRNKATE